MNENAIGKEVIDAAVKVHRGLGPGLLGGGGGQRTQRERIKLRVERQVPVPEGTLAAWRLGVRLGLKTNPCHQMWLRLSAERSEGGGSRQGAKPQRFCSEVVLGRELKGRGLITGREPGAGS